MISICAAALPPQGPATGTLSSWVLCLPSRILPGRGVGLVAGCVDRFVGRNPCDSDSELWHVHASYLPDDEFLALTARSTGLY